jgi:RNA polymerase sigma factor (sigma-70 family)
VTTTAQKKLIEAAMAGHLESFGELCWGCYPSMVAVAYSVLGDHGLAEDAAQEAFAKALVSLKKLKHPGRFIGWLAQICRNTAVDMVRARARRKHLKSSPVSTRYPHAESWPSRRNAHPISKPLCVNP